MYCERHKETAREYVDDGRELDSGQVMLEIPENDGKKEDSLMITRVINEKCTRQDKFFEG